MRCIGDGPRRVAGGCNCFFVFGVCELVASCCCCSNSLPGEVMQVHKGELVINIESEYGGQCGGGAGTHMKVRTDLMN